MALSDEQKKVWLSEDYHRIVIADIDYHDGTSIQRLRLSSYPYVMPIDDEYFDINVVNNTNLQTNPENFELWGASGDTVVTANAAISPSKLTESEKLEDANTALNTRYISGGFIPVSIGETYTFSVFAKAGEYTFLGLGLTIPFGDNAGVSFDLVNGVVGSQVGLVPAINYSITPAANGYYRCSITWKATSSGDLYTLIYSSDNSTNYNHTGVIGNGIYIWGAKLELSSIIGPYTATTNDIYFDYNELPKSEQFNSVYWPKDLCTVTFDAAIAPDGTLTADKLISDVTTGQHRCKQTVTLIPGTKYTFSVYVKAAEHTLVSLLVWNGTDSSIGAVGLNLVTGEVNNSVGLYHVSKLVDGWWHIAISTEAPTVAGNVVMIYANSLTTAPSTGDGVSGLYIWGAQLVQGVQHVDYISQSLISLNSDLIYDDVIQSVPNIIAKLDTDSTIGSLSLLNTDGEYDYLLNDVTLTGHTIKLFIGDINWPRGNFIPILDGIISGVSSSSPENITISLRDKKEALNIVLQHDLYIHDATVYPFAVWDALTVEEKADTGESWNKLMDKIAAAGLLGRKANSPEDEALYSREMAEFPEGLANTHIPICLGKCFNIEPILVDSFNHIYHIHDSTEGIVNISNVRSNGIPLVPYDGATPITVHSIAIDTYWGDGGGPGFVYNELIIDVNPGIEPIGRVLYFTGSNALGNVVLYYEPLTIVDFSNSTGNFKGNISGCTSVVPLGISPVVVSTSYTDGQYEVDLELGIIRLLDHAQGTQITCDVIGQNGSSSLHDPAADPLVPYSVADIIEWILLEKANIPFSEICQDTFPPTGLKGFDGTAECGLFYKDEQNIINVVSNLASSVGGFLRFRNAECKLQLVRFVDPLFETPILYLIDDDIIENGISISSIEEPKSSITLGYRKNWKQQDEGALAFAITEPNSPIYNLIALNTYKNLYSTLHEYTDITEYEYPLAEDVALIETYIWDVNEAQTELDRRIGLRGQRRRVIKIESLATSFTYYLGDIVNITHPRFGLTAGKNGIIIGIEQSLTTKRVVLEIWL